MRTKYSCKVNGCFGGYALCPRISDVNDDCLAVPNWVCEHRFIKPKPKAKSREKPKPKPVFVIPIVK